MQGREPVEEGDEGEEETGAESWMGGNPPQLYGSYASQDTEEVQGGSDGQGGSSDGMEGGCKLVSNADTYQLASVGDSCWQLY